MAVEEQLSSSIQDYYDKFSSSEHGLAFDTIESNRTKFGSNSLIQAKLPSFFEQFMKEILSLFPLLLLVASILSVVGHFIDPTQGYLLIGGALLFVVILNASVSLVQKRKVSAIMRSFAAYIPQHVLVVRDGQEQNIAADQIVCGDIIKLAEGDKIPAEAIILQQHNIQVDESILTGESGSIAKQVFDGSEKGVLYSGTTILRGNCVALVYNVGARTKLGKISQLTQNVEQPQTTMQKQINQFVRIISIIALGLGFSFFLLGIFVLEKAFITNIIFAIGIIVANVPEGLLPTVTLSLTQASQRMAKRNCIVKSVESVETLGSCTVICTDKTGTLTQNSMKAKVAYVNQTELDLQKATSANFLDKPGCRTFLEVITLCNDATFVIDKHNRIAYGDPTETALLSFADNIISVDETRDHFAILHEKPFSSEDQFMTKVFRTQGATKYTCIKGAPERIITRCTQHHINGEVSNLSQEQEQQYKKEMKALQSRGYRVLGLAYSVDEHVDFNDPQHCVFVGFIALIDPPRPEVFEAVKAAQTAGIKIIVVSGDHPQTVKAIAEQTGIAKDPVVVTGLQLAEMSDDQLKEVLQKEVLFARTKPEQKMRIVSTLQSLEEVVAVTGDGVNDAPALKQADIGVSMGKNGTDVAKDASDLILLDDNFATIVSAIKEGRTVYDNIKKFITYILTSNVPEILPFILMVIFNIPLAITVIQILAIDLITDILPAIGLGNERSEKDIMQRKPRSKKSSLVNWRTFLRSYGIVGPLQTIFAYVFFFYVLFSNGWTWGAELDTLVYMQATGAFLGAIIFAQIGNVVACRTNRQSVLPQLFKLNKWIVSGIALSILFLIFASSIPGIKQVFHMQPLPGAVWLLYLFLPIIIILVEELRKLAIRKGVHWLEP